MNRSLVKKFGNRWRRINELEEKENLNLSLQERLVKLLSTMQLGVDLGFTMDKETLLDIRKVRARWVVLKKLAK